MASRPKPFKKFGAGHAAHPDVEQKASGRVRIVFGKVDFYSGRP